MGFHGWVVVNVSQDVFGECFTRRLWFVLGNCKKSSGPLFAINGIGKECRGCLGAFRHKCVRDLGEMSGGELFQRSYVCRIQVEESVTSSRGQVWF